MRTQFVRPVTAAVLAGFFVAVTSLAAPAANAADTGAQDAVATVVLVGATLIDGTGRPPVPDAIVLVKGRRILAAGPRASTAIPRGARIVDVAGRWIMPGMIDAHVHFFETGRIYTKPGMLDLTRLVSYADEIRWMKSRVPVTLARYLCAGVTSAVSVGGPRFEYDVRDAARRTAKAPNVYIAHGPITGVRLGHDVFPPIDGDEATRYAPDAPAARAEVDRGVEWHADLIKAGYLGGPLAEAEKHYFEILPAIVAEAHARHLPVTMHVTEVGPARQAIEAGVDSLAHVVTDAVVDDDFLRLARDRHVTVVTTLAVWPREVEARRGQVTLTPMESRCGDPEVIRTWTEVKGLPPVADAEISSAAEALRIAMANVKRLHDYGIPLAVGVDPGNFGLLHGASVHRELELLAEAGIPAADIIVAATRNAARIAGKDGEVGTLEPGKIADLIVLSRDPLADIRNVAAIEQVMKGGAQFPEAQLLP